MLSFNKVLLIVLAMQLNIIIYFLGQIRWENDPIYRFLYLRSYIEKQMSAPVSTEKRTDT